MKRISIEELNKINLSSIKAAGPRYAPSLDPSAPNLQISQIISAVEALAITDKYRSSIRSLVIELSESWRKSSKRIIELLSQNNSPSILIRLLKKLANERPGLSQETLKSIQTRSYAIIKLLNLEIGKLRDKKYALKEQTEEKSKIDSELSSIRTFLDAIRHTTSSLVDISDFELIAKNRLFLLGEWGTGKTHLLCDITKDRMARKLPTLFFLAHHLTDLIDPFVGICQNIKIGSTPNQLLSELNKLGLETKTRSLLIIDGINEGDRKSWKKYMMKVIALIKKYKNIGIILSCRTPFDKQILTARSRKEFVNITHNGFGEIEFDAQRTFFNYYKIPHPHIPLLTPEFSRPLFLKILCETFSGQTSSTKSKWINEIASGQRAMTKLFEDFVNKIGSKIEMDFGLSNQICWRLLKGSKNLKGKFVGLAVAMAENVSDYLDHKLCISIIQEITKKSSKQATLIFKAMLNEGLLIEDYIWKVDKQVGIVRFSYQRFSDHLIARHLLERYLDTRSEKAVRRSFFKNKPLGSIFIFDKYGQVYDKPGLALAIMLEFPDRVKRVLPLEQRELVYYLPQKQKLLAPLIDTFLEGILWRSKDSFSDQTNKIFDMLLCQEYFDTQMRTLEVLTSLACRPEHPYSAQKLYNFLSKKTLIERDILWSEFLRQTHSSSVVYRLLNWVEDSNLNMIDAKNSKNLLLLLSLFLTTTSRPLRDKATKSLVLIGEKQPQSLFEGTLASLTFNDPYVSERMLAASYGVLMRNWAFPSTRLLICISQFAKDLYDAMFKQKALYATTHILTRDYACGIIELARKIDDRCLGKRQVSRLNRPFDITISKIPKANKIKEQDCKLADHAILMDFENYTIGHLVPGRGNYDSKHNEYRGVLRQVKWRILDLGYSYELFKAIDESINRVSYYKEQNSSGSRIDRYGKKYSWVAYFEVAGIRSDMGLLSENFDNLRISDCDIDPSFPGIQKSWVPKLNKLFNEKYIGPRAWIIDGIKPSYDHLLQLDIVNDLPGPWILLHGFILQSSEKDPRKVFTFLNALLLNAIDIASLKEKFKSKKYPGNRIIPEASSDYYTFSGEVPWSNKYGQHLRKKRKAFRNVSECLDDRVYYKIRKKRSSLSKFEQIQFSLPRVVFVDDKGNEIDSLNTPKEKVENLSEYVEVSKYRKIPGVMVEVPIHRLAWETYHSNENQNGGGFYPAPSLCENLELRNKGESHDLFDSYGREATLYRLFGDDSIFNGSSLFYIRKDLIDEYLVNTNQKLVWLNWGEREIEYKQIEKERDQLHDIWDSNKHIHKRFKIY
jgi:DNA replication protein DnaC